MANLRFLARMFNVGADNLAGMIATICGPGATIGVSLKEESSEQRRSAELAFLSILPFDCYIVDELSLLPETAMQRLFSAAEQQGAGVIFATNSLRLVQAHADCAVVIRDKILYPFSDVEEAIAFHER